MRIVVSILALIVAGTGIAAAERPRLITLDDPHQPHITEAAAPYNTIFLNRCANGCTVKAGDNDSRVDTWPFVSGVHILTKFGYGDDSWNKVMACVKYVKGSAALWE